MNDAMARAFNQASALQARGDLPGAEKIYRALLMQNPKHFAALESLATILFSGEQQEEAVELLRKALNQQPNNAVAHGKLAYTLQLLDRNEEALQRARRSIALNPMLPDAHATLSQILVNLGRYDEAISALAAAIALAPDRARFYYYWGQITKWTADDPKLRTLEALAQNSASRPPAEQAELSYPGAGDPFVLPVFVLGMPRSRTTLVEQILASHPKVRAFGERIIFNDALARMCGTATVPSAIAQRAAQWSDAELARLGALYVAAIRSGMPKDVERIVDKLRRITCSSGLFTRRCRMRTSSIPAAIRLIAASRCFRYCLPGFRSCSLTISVNWGGITTPTNA